MRAHWLALAAATALFACSSTNNTTNVYNGSDGGPGNGNGPGGGGVDCSAGCMAETSAGCAHGQTQAQCESQCQAAEQKCPNELSAAFACLHGKAVTCDASGVPAVSGCDTQGSALVQCLEQGGAAPDAGSGPGSGTGGNQVPPGGACGPNDSCAPIACKCVDGKSFPPIGYCYNSVCQDKASGCPDICSSDGGWSGS
jgi:hypothetical protein